MHSSDKNARRRRAAPVRLADGGPSPRPAAHVSPTLTKQSSAPVMTYRPLRSNTAQYTARRWPRTVAWCTMRPATKPAGGALRSGAAPAARSISATGSGAAEKCGRRIRGGGGRAAAARRGMTARGPSAKRDVRPYAVDGVVDGVVAAVSTGALLVPSRSFAQQRQEVTGAFVWQPPPNRHQSFAGSTARLDAPPRLGRRTGAWRPRPARAAAAARPRAAAASRQPAVRTSARGARLMRGVEAGGDVVRW
jgi:hypothetical protein